ncbi:RNA 2'-phosphotransferase [Brevibacillus dissolubilis]|uniref:RNA 2'-phosphotransferase n=1 Tax=Brevibacillus dissolubilis TaxID=1844116 RepID=UPI001115FB3A|nr:RNA 2'-phosphotransferase [Brevibacillus dissolubilis]
MVVHYVEERLRNRLLSILRQNSGNIFLYFDTYGFTSVEKLLPYIRTLKGVEGADLDALRQVVEHDPKKQFEWDGGALIRTTYGFSPGRDHKGRAETPPDTLYYGTHRKLLQQIRGIGLIPIASDMVQLAVNPEDIGSVGDGLIIIPVNAKEAHRDGIRFNRIGERYYFVAELPAKYLEVGEEGM